MKNKLYLLTVLTTTVLSSSTNADFSNWYKTVTSNDEVVKQRPTQVQQQPMQQRQYSANQKTTTVTRYPDSNSNVTSNSSLEVRMNNLNATIENLNKSLKSGDKLTNNYLNIVQFIVINNETQKLDGKDNTLLINNMLNGVVSCQNKYKVDVIQKVNNQLPRDVSTTVQQYLSQNRHSISANANCLY